MIKCKSSIKLNMPVIRQLKEAQIKALEQTGEYLHTKVVQAQVVPKKDGVLQGESFFVDTSKSSVGKVQLVHAAPYARRLYFHPEYEFHKEPWEETIKHKDGTVSHLKHDGNPNAKALWFKDYESGGKYQKLAQKAYERLYRRIAGL